MPQLTPEGNTVAKLQQTPVGSVVNNIKQKIEQLELELPQLMNTIQMNKAQMDESTLQMRVFSDMTEPLDNMQIQVRIFLQEQISKCTLDITDCTKRMGEISTRLIEQRGLVNAIHNDGTNPKAFAEDGRTTDRTKDSLPKRDIASVEGVQEGASKRSLASSAGESNESFNTVKDAASHHDTVDTIVKQEPKDAGAPDGNGMNALSAAAAELTARSPPSSIQSFGSAEVSRIPALSDSDKEGGSEYNLPVPAEGKGICLSAVKVLATVLIPQSDSMVSHVESDVAIRKEVSTTCIVMELNGTIWGAPTCAANVGLFDTLSGSNLPIVSLDPENLSVLGLQLQCLADPMSDPRSSCCVVGMDQYRPPGASTSELIAQCFFGHDNLPQVQKLTELRSVPPAASVSYKGARPDLEDTYFAAPGHQTWYWEVDGRSFAAVPVIEITNGNFRDFGGSHSQMLTLCQTLFMGEKPQGVANLLQSKIGPNKSEIIMEDGTHKLDALPFGDSNGKMSAIKSSLLAFSEGVGLPFGLVHTNQPAARACIIQFACTRGRVMLEFIREISEACNDIDKKVDDAKK